MSGRRERVSAAPALARRMKPGRASDFFRPIDDLKPGIKVVLCGRDSARSNAANLPEQVANLRREVAAHGASVVGVEALVASGKEPWLWPRAAALAEQHDAVLLFESVSRAVRHPDFDSKECPDAQPTTFDLENLRYWTAGVPLMTVVPPDAAIHRDEMGNLVLDVEGGA